jgi:hypothetical protein
MRLLAELRRRNVIRVAGLYLVSAWLLTQVAGTVLPMFGAPDWVARSIVIVLALGFVPMLVFSWVFELTPQGLKRDAEVAPGESISPLTARRMDRMIIVVLLLASTYFGFDRLVLAPRRDAARRRSAIPLRARRERDQRVAPVRHWRGARGVPSTPFAPRRATARRASRCIHAACQRNRCPDQRRGPR